MPSAIMVTHAPSSHALEWRLSRGFARGMGGKMAKRRGVAVRVSVSCIFDVNASVCARHGKHM